MARKEVIDWEQFFDEEEALEGFPDREEAALRENMLEEIRYKVFDYYAHIRDYDYAQHRKGIEDRGLIFKPIAKRTATRKWDAFFAKDLSREEKRQIYYSSFKWHMFSYEKVAAKEGSAAKRAFNRCKKGAAYLFIQCTNEAWYIENAQLLTAADLGVDFDFCRADVYLFDAKGKWAYVRTHEITCGPYFLRMP